MRDTWSCGRGGPEAAGLSVRLPEGSPGAWKEKPALGLSSRDGLTGHRCSSRCSSVACSSR